MDKTTSFFGGIIAGAIGLGVASWYFGEYLPNKKEEKERLATLDLSGDQESDVDSTEEENIDKAEATDDEEQSSDSESQSEAPDNKDTIETEK